ncbi:MAG TPA: SPASM domain-containing protein [Candidatus Omnitrophota bacterium]|nr:SPASM domain-containing protein [Candidatus Omnitrophota bacterium]
MRSSHGFIGRGLSVLSKKFFKKEKHEIALFQKLLLELQADCNRDCFFCPRHGDASGKRKHGDGSHVAARMPTEKALSILDQAREMGFSGQVSFHHHSEPFLDERIIAMAWEARKRGMRVYEHTNGDVLRSNEKLAREAAAVFDYIVVGLYDHKSEAELSGEKAFWEKKLKDTQVYFSQKEFVYPRNFVEYDRRMIREKKAYPSAPCRRPSIRFIVHYDGETALCCEDMQAAYHLGNAFHIPIKDIWYSSKHIQMIKDLEQGMRRRYPLCGKCPLPPA